MTYPYITRNCVRNFVIFFFFISIRNSRHSETQIWLTNSFFFVCVVFGEFSIGKNQFFPVSFFLSFSKMFFWMIFGHLLQDDFLREKKQSSHYDVTLSHFQIDFSFSWLDWGHSTASNQLQFFFQRYFHENKWRLLWPFSVWPFFSVSVMPHTEYGIKVLIFFAPFFRKENPCPG